MRTIKQGRNDGYCVAACAAILCNTSVKDFIKVIGEPTTVCGNPKLNLTGYRDYDFERYLILHNKSIDFARFRRSAIDLRKNTVIVRYEYSYKKMDAYLVVKSQRHDDVTHAVVWDSKKKCVRDPNPFLPARRKLSDYDIVYWIPIFNI